MVDACGSDAALAGAGWADSGGHPGGMCAQWLLFSRQDRGDGEPSSIGAGSRIAARLPRWCDEIGCMDIPLRAVEVPSKTNVEKIPPNGLVQRGSCVAVYSR